MAKVNYIGLFLTPESRRQLLDWCPPIHKNISADHITLAFKPDAETLAKLTPLLGQNFEVRLTDAVADDKGQAMGVIIKDLPFVENLFPHITISCAEGIQPAYSNELMEKGLFKPSWRYALKSIFVALGFVTPKTVRTVLDTYPRVKRVVPA
jgi:hypothetical protein